MELPKPNGGVRILGIPTVLDRLIQQALLQVLQPEFGPEFSGVCQFISVADTRLHQGRPPLGGRPRLGEIL